MDVGFDDIFLEGGRQAGRQAGKQAGYGMLLLSEVGGLISGKDVFVSEKEGRKEGRMEGWKGMLC